MLLNTGLVLPVTLAVTGALTGIKNVFCAGVPNMSVSVLALIPPTAVSNVTFVVPGIP